MVDDRVASQRRARNVRKIEARSQDVRCLESKNPGMTEPAHERNSGKPMTSEGFEKIVIESGAERVAPSSA